MNGYEQQPIVAEPVGPQKNWRPIIVAALVGLAVVLLAIGGIWIWRAASRPAPEQAALEEQIGRIEDACAREENPGLCRQNRLLALSESTGRGDICGQLQGEARDLCIYRDAQRSQDGERCSDLSTVELRSGCVDVILMTSAQMTGEASICDRISDPDTAASCRSAIEAMLTAEACRTQGRDSSLCDDIAATEAAFAAGDLAFCDTVNDQERRFACEDMVGGLDVDRDGLNAYDERTYGTDPRNPDTDGDGFNDGLEVSGGFNPNGPGRL